MRTAVVAAVIAAVLALAATSTLAASDSKQAFEEFKAKYGKTYGSAAEEGRRYAIFVENMRKASALQASNPLAKFGANEFADMSAVEFKSRHNGDQFYRRALRRQAEEGKFTDFSAAEKAAVQGQAIDWRAKGAVTYVKNQGQCGSCWSFSTTGGIEGAWFLAGNTLVALSEQELVSCDTTDNGCNGGLMDNAFGWLIDNQGGWITSEAAYPYVSGAGQVPACSISGMPQAAQITSFANYANSESAMAAGCAANGPVSIGVDATSWQSYQGGILTDCTSTQVDHGVLIVGYDLSYSTPYWIIKNSWSPSWGENGYIRVAYGSNQCLITSAPSHPIAGSGPAPSPGPTAQPTPAPSSPPTPPASGTFTQYQCDNFLCVGCQGQTFNQGQCLQLQGGGSAIAECTSSQLQLTVYSGSNSCQGASQTESQPLDQCLQDESGSYIYNTCTSGAASLSTRNAKPASVSAKLRNLKKK